MNTIQIKPNAIKKIKLSLFVLFTGILLTACGRKRPEPESPYVPENFLAESERLSFDRSLLNAIPNNPFPTLSVPTYITMVEDTYFIVDCYNNQVIYHDNLNDTLY